MSYPKTKEEWWALADEVKDELYDLLLRFHPRCHRTYGAIDDMEITAPGAERACEVVRRQITTEGGNETAEETFARCCKDRSADLASLLNEIWFGIPESIEAHNLEGFSELCDLCSESYVLEDPDETMQLRREHLDSL